VHVELLHHPLVDLEPLPGLLGAGTTSALEGAVDSLGGGAELAVLHLSMDVLLPEPEGGAPRGVLVVGHQVWVVDQPQVVVESQRGRLVVVAVGELDVAAAVVLLAGSSHRVVVPARASSLSAGQLLLVPESTGLPEDLRQKHGRLP